MDETHKQESSTSFEIVADPTAHLCQTDGSLLDSKYFGETLRGERGICWAASMSMAVSAITGYDSREVLDRVGWLTYDYYPNHFSDVQEQMREVFGPEGAVPFLEHARTGLVSPVDGELKDYFRLNYPTHTAHMLSLLIQEQLGMNVEVTVNPKSFVLPYDWETEVVKNYRPGKVAVLAVDIAKIDKSSGKSAQHGHMVYISGMEQRDDRLSRLRISDPNKKSIIWLNRLQLNAFSENQLKYSDTPLHVSMVCPVRLGPLIWFSDSEE